MSEAKTRDCLELVNRLAEHNELYIGDFERDKAGEKIVSAVITFDPPVSPKDLVKPSLYKVITTIPHPTSWKAPWTGDNSEKARKWSREYEKSKAAFDHIIHMGFSDYGGTSDCNMVIRAFFGDDKKCLREARAYAKKVKEYLISEGFSVSDVRADEDIIGEAVVEINMEDW